MRVEDIFHSFSTLKERDSIMDMYFFSFMRHIFRSAVGRGIVFFEKNSFVPNICIMSVVLDFYRA